LAEIAGFERKIHFLAMDLPHRDAYFLCEPIWQKLPKRSVTGTTRRSRSLARCRARSCTTTPRWRWRASWATECASARGYSASCSRIKYLPIGLAGPAKATTKAREARFPTVKSLDSFDFTAMPSLNKTLVLELVRGEYIARRDNAIAVGNSGTGKTHIALGLGLAAC
jgi:hypothetical protein